MPKKIPSLFLASLAALSLTSCQQPHTHTYDLDNPVWEWSQFSSATVSFACKECGESAEGHVYTVDADVSVKESVAATCEKEGYKVHEATATFEERTFIDTKTQKIPASGHSEDTSLWNFDESKHWHPCLYCGDAFHYEEAEHSMTDWEQTLAPTYHEEGSRERHCTVCAYTETESVDKLRYSYKQVSEFAQAFLSFPSGSAYLGRALDSLLDGIENMDLSEKEAHSEEVSQWQEAANKEKEAYDENYCILVDTEGMDTYDKTKTEETVDAAYGNVLKVNGDGELITGECWSFGPDRKASVVKDGISAIRFAIYAPEPMNVAFINNACDTWYDASSGEVVSKKAETTMSKGTWQEFIIPTSAISQMDTFKIALYLSPSPFIGYGIPTVSDSETYGSAYISEIIGVKPAYYEDMASELDERISSFSGRTLTMWDGADLRKMRSDYDSLPSVAKSLVKNLSSLSEMEGSYGEKWACLNYSWVRGKVNASTTIKSATVGRDDTYGVYTEFDATDSSWIVHFTPESEQAVTSGAKIAIYKPEGATVSAYYIDNSWGNSGTVALEGGWNVVDVPASAFLNGVASGVSIGLANATTAEGYKFTPLYVEK